MTSHGHPNAIYRRALEAGDLPMAVAAAHNIPHLVAARSLPLLLLYRERDPVRYPRAAALWATAATRENTTVTVAGLAQLAAALEQLANQPAQAAQQLAQLSPILGLGDLRGALEDLC